MRDATSAAVACRLPARRRSPCRDARSPSAAWARCWACSAPPGSASTCWPGFNPWFIAPMGASAVLLFAVPSSPLAQPWSIIGGNLVSRADRRHLRAPACRHRRWPARLAGSLAIGAMFSLRCLHPPSGAVALTAVLGGPAVQALGYAFVLVARGGRLAAAADGRAGLQRVGAAPLSASCARRPRPRTTRATQPPSARVGLTAQDLHAALRRAANCSTSARTTCRSCSSRPNTAPGGAASAACAATRSCRTTSSACCRPRPRARPGSCMIRHAVKALPVVDAARARCWASSRCTTSSSATTCPGRGGATRRGWSATS